MKNILLGLAFVGLVACVPETSPRAPAVQGQTATGAPIFDFTLTRVNAFGVTPVSERAIAERALMLCPGGYQEVSRYGQAERRVSGFIYTDITVRIICK